MKTSNKFSKALFLFRSTRYAFSYLWNPNVHFNQKGVQPWWPYMCLLWHSDQEVQPPWPLMGHSDSLHGLSWTFWPGGATSMAFHWHSDKEVQPPWPLYLFNCYLNNYYRCLSVNFELHLRVSVMHYKLHYYYSLKYQSFFMWYMW